MDPNSGRIYDESELTEKQKETFIPLTQKRASRLVRMSLETRIEWARRLQNRKERSRKLRAQQKKNRRKNR